MDNLLRSKQLIKLVCLFILDYTKLVKTNKAFFMLEKTSADPLFMQDAASKAAGLLRTVGNEHRLLMLCLLIEHEELTVGELLQYVDLSQSAVSQHLARMRDEGIVDVRRNGLNMYYRIVNPNVKVLVAALKDIFCP